MTQAAAALKESSRPKAVSASYGAPIGSGFIDRSTGAQARLVEAYERAEWPRTAPPLPILLAYLMDQHGLSRADLVPLLGTASRVSEVLSGKRDFSMTMVRRLRERFDISADLLVLRGRARNKIAA